MSRERELLEHCRMYLSSLGMFYEHGKLINNIDELLAQPEQIEQEPVAWMYEWEEIGGKEWTSVKNGKYPPIVEEEYCMRNLRPLYLVPPKREPFGPEERQRLSKAYSTRAEQVAFEEGIIFAEISYGIGGE